MSRLISIIIPVYNTERYLRLCLESILNQSFSDFEVLLIDDGSTDGSAKICEEYACRDSRVLYFHKENGGVSSARNLGLDHSKGEWIFFVDSDDEVLSGGLQILVDGIRNDCDVVLGGYVEYDESNVLTFSVPEPMKTVLTKGESVSTLFQFHSFVYPYLGYMWLRLFRRRIIQEYGLRFDPDITVKEDTLFTLQYICRSNGRTSFDSTPVYKYKLRPESAMGGWRRGFDEKYLTSFYALKKMKREITSCFSPLSEVVFIAKEALLVRYDLISDRLNELGMDNPSLLAVLRKELKKEHIGFLFRLRRKVKKTVRKCSNSYSRSLL